MKNFLVYKSSAGSGKTYTLMLVYLGIVLKDPARYRNILAVTFTNKAANEIKQRIISSLTLIASLNENSIPASNQHLISALSERTKLSFTDIKKNAEVALKLILHHYSDFAVSTIDSFIHRIIRAFAFDLKLLSNFEVEMDTDFLLSLAVDKLLADVGADETLTRILVSYIEDLAENDDSWQIEGTLQKFAKILFNENARDYLPLVQSFTPEKLAIVNKKLRIGIKQFDDTLSALSSEALQLVQNQGLIEKDFYRSYQGIYGYFKNPANRLKSEEPNNYVRETIDKGKWCSNSCTNRDAVVAITEDLVRLFNEVEMLISNDYGKYLLYKNLRKGLYPTSVLKELGDRLRLVVKDRNVVPIAEFNSIIAGIVLNEPVPFIYERTGEKFRHYLIDEFQDTSVLQWQNMLPLLDNSLALGGLNMIVGDGKQAIYRFRNGDVEQFVNLPQIANPGGSPIIEQRSQVLEREYVEHSLDSNFRSLREVIEFNNNFFSFTSDLFLEAQKLVFEGVEQHFNPEKTGGLVQIEFLTGQEDSYKNETCQRVLELIADLTHKGYRAGDITVLTPKNEQASWIATHLNANNIQVVSSESLLLKISPEVNFLIHWFQALANPANPIARAGILEYLFAAKLLGEKSRMEAFLASLNPASFQRLIESEGFVADSGIFSDKSLFDQTEALVRIFNLHEKSPLYVQFFLDEVLKFSTSRTSGIPGFLEYWEKEQDKLSVILPATSNAVQIMTIHKSKGLEFPVVIHAFADGKAEIKNSAWVQIVDPELIADLPVALLKLDKSALRTEYAHVYETEFQKRKLDLLNLLYVAFTRASEHLYVLSSKPAKDDKEVKSVTDLLVRYLNHKKIYVEGQTVYTFGEGSWVHGRKNEEESLPDMLFLSYPWQERLIFAARAPQFWEADKPGDSQLSGNLLHYALSQIVVASDAHRAIYQLVSEGLLIEDKQQEMLQKIERILLHPDMARFFAEGVRVLNEAEIIAPGGKSYRPDRVVLYDGHTDVIDYKTGAKNTIHAEQVKHYAGLLMKMGYPNPRAWLLYIADEPEVLPV